MLAWLFQSQAQQQYLPIQYNHQRSVDSIIKIVRIPSMTVNTARKRMVYLLLMKRMFQLPEDLSLFRRSGSIVSCQTLNVNAILPRDALKLLLRKQNFSNRLRPLLKATSMNTLPVRKTNLFSREKLVNDSLLVK